MPTFEYTKNLLEADKDVPYRACSICHTLMSFTMRNYQPHLISCKCRKSGEQALCVIPWDDLQVLLPSEKK